MTDEYALGINYFFGKKLVYFQKASSSTADAVPLPLLGKAPLARITG